MKSLIERVMATDDVINVTLVYGCGIRDMVKGVDDSQGRIENSIFNFVYNDTTYHGFTIAITDPVLDTLELSPGPWLSAAEAVYVQEDLLTYSTLKQRSAHIRPLEFKAKLLAVASDFPAFQGNLQVSA